MTMRDESLQNIGQMSLDLEMSERAGRTTLHQSISSPVGSRAQILARRAKARASGARVAASGSSLRALLASYDRATSSWRTSQRSLNGDSAMFSGRWPRSGTMRNGSAYQRRPLVPLTSVIASSLLPTIVASEYKGSQRNRHIHMPTFRGSKMSEGLRTCEDDPIYLNPCFGDVVMGFPEGWTDLED